MECLLNLVDFLDGTKTRDSSKLYINDIPGFELSQPEYVVNGDQTDSLNFLEQCKKEAATRLLDEFTAHLNERAKYNSVLRNQRAGVFEQNLIERAAVSARYGGVQLSIASYPYLSLYVDRIGLFTKNSVTTNIKVFDLQQGIELDSFPITTVGGEITYIQVGKEYKNNAQYLNLIFVIDTSLTPTYNTITSSCGHCFYNLEALNQYIDGRGVSIGQSQQKIDTNIKGEGHTNGITLSYSIQCDPSYFICGMANRFANALRYLWFAEFNRWIVKSTRGNSLTTIHKDDAIANVNEYEEKFAQSMKVVLANITIPNNLCYSCDPYINMKSKFS